MPTYENDLTLASPELRSCPFCGSRMRRWYTPPQLSWGTIYQYVCFNDECTYYQRGWAWMEQKYKKKASYRHRYNPFHGDSGPLPVWSATALVSDIIPDEEDPQQFALRRGSSK